MPSWLDVGLALPGTVLVLACILPSLHASLRAWARPTVVRLVQAQIPWVLRVQRRHSPFMDTFAKLSTLTVTVEFYLIFLPLLIWCDYLREAFTLTVGLAFATYVTCCWKDIICGPRPAGVVAPDALVVGHSKGAAAGGGGAKSATLTAAMPPPASNGGPPAGAQQQAWEVKQQQQQKLRVLEVNGEIEYGAPSMHVSLALFMNLYFVHVMMGRTAGSAVWPAGPEAFPLPLAAAYTAAVAWAAWIAWTRLYVGVHTPVDLSLGACLGASLFLLWRAVAPAYYNLLDTWDWMWQLHLAIALLMLMTYPRPLTHTTSYLYAVTFLGASLGLTLGFCLGGVIDARPAWMALVGDTIELHPVGTSRPVRIAIGVALTLTTSSVIKKVLVAVLPALLALVPPDVRAHWQPPINTSGQELKGADRVRATGAGLAAPAPAPAKPVGKTTAPAADVLPGGGYGSGVTAVITDKRWQNGGPVQQGLGGGDGKGIGSSGHSCGSDGGSSILRKADGFPWDADIARRFLGYAFTVWMVTVWGATSGLMSHKLAGREAW